MNTYVCDLDAGGWSLYLYDDDYSLATNRARSKRRGISLSKRLTKLVAKAKERLKANPLLAEVKLAEQIRDKMYKLMGKYDDDGAMDTEPQCVLVSELERAFGFDSYTLDR